MIRQYLKERYHPVQQRGMPYHETKNFHIAIQKHDHDYLRTHAELPLTSKEMQTGDRLKAVWTSFHSTSFEQEYT